MNYPRRHNRANTAVTHEKSKYDMTSLYRQPMVVGSSPTTSSILVIPNGYSPEKARIIAAQIGNDPKLMYHGESSDLFRLMLSVFFLSTLQFRYE